MSLHMPYAPSNGVLIIFRFKENYYGHSCDYTENEH